MMCNPILFSCIHIDPFEGTESFMFSGGSLTSISVASKSTRSRVLKGDNYGALDERGPGCIHIDPFEGTEREQARAGGQGLDPLHPHRPVRGY